MIQSNAYHRQNIFDSTGLLPAKNWKTAALHLLLLTLVVFLSEVSAVRADGLFDFQMKLAEKGNAEAQYKIGDMYETGFGTAKNMKLAEEWTAKAADQGHETAGFKQLYWDMRKNGITKSNKPKFDAVVNKAKIDNPYAQYYMGRFYTEGLGVTKDYTIALDWLNKATLQGVVEAERETLVVKEDAKRDEVVQRRAEQERQAELRAKQEDDKRKEAERLAAQKKAETDRAGKQAEDKSKQTAASAAKKAEEEKARLAQQAAAQQAQQREQEAKRKVVVEQREKTEDERKAEFESDPCAGKSARFLSTCR